MPRGSLLEYRAVVRDHDGDLGVATTYAIVGDAPAPGGGGGDDGPVGPVEQPAAVSIPGSHGSEIGCPDSSTDGGTDPGDWDPGCEQAQLGLDGDDDIWKTTVSPAASGYAFKAAINRGWDENYGQGGVRDGGDIGYTAPGGPVSFYYDHRTHWVTNDVLHDIVTVAGSFQSEMGCAADWDPSCMRAWLQDPDDNDVYTLSTTEVPAGSYAAKATVGLGWDENYGAGGVPNGPDIVFSVGEGEATTFRFDRATNVLTISTAPATPEDTGPDLATSEASWVQPDLVVWEGAPQAPGTTYRLFWGPEGSLGLDAETVTGGSSVPLAAGPDGLRLSKKDARALRAVFDSGGAGHQVAVAAFDDLGRLADATGVQVAP
jgi:hypothetical protein